MTRIVGLDIGCNFAVAAVLEEFPTNLQKHYSANRKKFLKLKADESGAKKLIDLEPDGVVMEPTGGWYSSFWYALCKTNDIPVFWVGHTDLKAQRQSYGFTNKRDPEDALCLAATFFDERFIDFHGVKRFIPYRSIEIIEEIRETFLERRQLDKNLTRHFQHLRQRMNLEFPEAARITWKQSKRTGLTNYPAWLTGEYKSARLDRKYAKSICHEIGTGITPYTKEIAAAAVITEKQIIERDNRLMMLLDKPEFTPYLEVFRRFRISLHNQAMLLVTIYPFERFLVNGKSWIEHHRNDNGKRQKYDRSLSKFQATMGLSFRLEQSGDSLKKKFHGSAMARAFLYQWSKAVIARGVHDEDRSAGFMLDNEIGENLGRKYEDMRLGDTPLNGKDALIRLSFKASRLLFRELKKAIAE